MVRCNQDRGKSTYRLSDFLSHDSGEVSPNDYQKIPYHIVFDVKYDLRHRARLVAGCNGTENEREGIPEFLRFFSG
jgi:hypothetical protein